jgi:hypothetical protein
LNVRKPGGVRAARHYRFNLADKILFRFISNGNQCGKGERRDIRASRRT